MGIILRYNDFLKIYKTRSHRLNHLQNYKYLFPITSSPKLAGIVGDLMGDGHLQGHPKWRVDYTSKSPEELKRFESEIKSIFNVGGSIRPCTTNKLSKSFNLGINNAPIARILFLTGVPHGEKVLQNFEIPSWICNDKECFRNFARRLFTCEGSIMDEKNRKIPQIRLNMWKSEVFHNIKPNFLGMLGHNLNSLFGIQSTIIRDKAFNIRKDKIKTLSYTMYICNLSAVKFFEQVGFEGEKQDKLIRIFRQKHTSFLTNP